MSENPGARFRGVWAAAGHLSNNSSKNIIIIIPRQLDRDQTGNMVQSKMTVKDKRAPYMMRQGVE